MACLVASLWRAAPSARSLDLDKPLGSAEQVIFAPEGDLSSPSDASLFGFMSRLSRIALVPFGVESNRAEPRPPTGRPVVEHTIAAQTLRQALDAICRIDPRYAWSDADGVVLLRPRGAAEDTGDPLNRQVRDIRWQGLTSFTAFDAVAHLLYPDDRRDYFAALKAPAGRPIDVDVTDGTIVDVLNAVVRSDGELGWWVHYGGATDDRRVEMTIGHYGVGPTASWK